MNPYRPQACKPCNQSGYNPETKKIADNFYEGERWKYNITQADVDHLVSEGRLKSWNSATRSWEPWSGLTAAMVNEAQLGHPMHDLSLDGCCQYMLVEFRAKQRGVYGHCAYCGGKGHLWPDDSFEKLSEDWTSTPPPDGPGWQLWETVSEGSPISPVFPTAEGLIDWIVETQGASREAAEKFVRGAGWVPSMAMVDGQCYVGIEAIKVMK